ncbi:hypothetical protein E5676_scaffold120G00400 [Cucumis melo var. makuwa]|uniref:Uncharacterized protein n=1 Tax=Cucumis melo var. makuwa TaxID=1194695 RepID=A0A5A7VCV6_CUCMM|nr:hypothetical protein E6C27_scaffold62G00980 [Cucumis melo var. makuwa]TYK28951.1 hypothetical protein E5676_scaffold120G00400 [Cucumis melo var. makuwa]
MRLQKVRISSSSFRNRLQSDITSTKGDQTFAVRSTVLVKTIGGQSRTYHQIHLPSRNDQTSSFCFTISDPTSTMGQSGTIRHLRCVSPSAIQLLLRDDRAFAIRSTTLVGTIRNLCYTFSSAIQLLLGEDRALDLRSIDLVGAIEHLCCASLSAIQLLLRDDQHLSLDMPNRNDHTSSLCFIVNIQLLLRNDRAFAVRSTALIRMIEHLYCALPSVIQLLLEDDQTFAIRSTILVGMIGHLHCQRSNFL